MSAIPGLRFGEFQGFPALLISTPFAKAAISLSALGASESLSDFFL